MAEIITRTIQINGTDVAIKTTGQLKQAVKLLNTEIDKADTGTPPYNKLIKQLGTVKALQQVNRNEVRNFKNETLAAGKTATGAYDQLSKKLLVTRQRYKDLAAAGREGTKEAKELLTTTQRLDTRLKGIDRTVGQNQRNVGDYLGSLQGFGKQFLSVLGVGGALAIGARLLQSSAQTILDFDRQLIAVSKTTDLTGNELNHFSDDVKNLGADLEGISIQGLLDSSEIAGQLGIRGSDNILRFSKTIEQLKLTSDIAGEESARNFAKFIEVSSDSVENADRLGSVITILGNNFATTEKAVLKNSTEIAKGVAVYNTSAQGLLAIGAATSALGSEAEASRSAIQTTFNVIDQAITSGEGLEDILKLTGLTQKELSTQFQKDASGVFVKFIQGLNEAKNSGANLREILTRLDIDEKRAFTVVGALSSNYDILAEAIALANEEYKENSALTKESERAADSINSIIGDVGDSWNKLVLSFEDGSGPLSDTFKNLAGGVVSLLNLLTDYNSLSVSEKINQERVSLNNLVGAITDSNTSQEVRNDLIEKLQNDYPDFLGNINAETASNGELLTKLKSVNQEYLQRERFARNEEEIAAVTKEIVDLEEKRRILAVDRQRSKSGDSFNRSERLEFNSLLDKKAEDRIQELTLQLDSLKIAGAFLNEDPLEFIGEDQVENSKELAESQEEVASSVKKTGDVAKSVAAEGSLAFLKKEAADLRKEIEENRTTENPLLDKVEDLVAKETEIKQLETSIEKLERRISRTGSAEGLLSKDTLAPLPTTSTFGSVDQVKSQNDQVVQIHDDAMNDIKNSSDQCAEEEEKKAEEADKERKERAKKNVRALADIAQSGFQAAFDIRRIQIDRNENAELDALENVYSQRIEAAEGNTAEQERLEAELEQRRLEIQQKAFEDRKRVAIREALINGALAITKALTLGPFSFAAIGPIVAATAAQVAVISAQQFEAEEGIRVEPDGTLTHSNGSKGHIISNGKGKKGVNNFTPKYILERGGRLDSSNFFRGASHEGGGINTFLNGVPVEVENGEFADVDEFNAVNVINRIDSTLHRTALRQQAGKIYSGKADFLNSVNSGHGRSFAKEGIVIPGVNNALADNRRELSSIINVNLQSSEISVAIEKGLEKMIPAISNAVMQGSQKGSQVGSQLGTQLGSQQGTAKGITDSSREQRREDNLKKRSKI